MNAIALGPLLFSAERFAAIVGIVAFYIVMVAAGRVVKRPLGDLALTMILAGGVGARLVHVLFHIESFAPEPLRILYIWQGGFNIWGSILGLLGVALWKARRLPVFAGTAAAGVVGFGLWGFILLLSQQTSSAPLPRTALETLDGERINLAQFQGEPLVINLWATWCPPCRREMPLLAEADQRPGVTVVLANQGEQALAVTRFLQSEQLTLEYALLDPAMQLMALAEAQGLPATLVFDGDGQLIERHIGELSRAQLDALLPESRP